MEWRALGETGIKVSKWTLGSMSLGRIGNPDHDECRQIIHRALAAGINCIDTADVHSYGESEEIIGRALREVPRDDVVLCGRVGGPMDQANPHVRRGGSRRWLVRAVEDSLRRLQVDHLDVLTLNRFDERTALDETLAALSDLVREGKARVIGSCTWPAERLVEAQWTSEARGHLTLRVEQPPYSLLVRHPEAAILPTAARHGIGVMTWSPLRGGWLTGRYRRDHMPLDSPRARFMPNAFDPALPDNQRKLDAVEQYLRIAEGAGLSPAHMALAFAARHPAVSTVCIGPRTLEHLDDLLKGVEVELADDVLDALDQVVPPGESIRPTYTGFANHDLLDPARRRRQTSRA